MLTVKDIMSTNIVSVKPDTEIIEAAKILLENRFNGLPVVDDSGKVVGIICQSDLIAQQKSLPIPTLFTFLDGFIPLTSLKKMESEIQKIAAITVADAMTKKPVTVKPDTRIETVAALMADKKLYTLPVLDDDGRLIGIVGKEDLLKSVIKRPVSTDE
jgi:CBS-domain-containing membrane protein